MNALRTFSRLPRTRVFPISAHVPRRYAHQSYGGEDSGHPKSDSAPRRDVEHPGPEAPDTTGSGSKSTSSSSSQSSGQSDKGRPAIHQPKSAAESEDPEVKKHNEEMRNRAEKSANQLSEDDNKVPPGYWKGDVGTKEKGD